jgi:hypothetical protein
MVDFDAHQRSNKVHMETFIGAIKGRVPDEIMDNVQNLYDALRNRRVKLTRAEFLERIKTIGKDYLPELRAILKQLARNHKKETNGSGSSSGGGSLPASARFLKFAAVTIHGLQSAMALKYNFAKGAVESFDATNDRYLVRIVHGPFMGELLAVRSQCLMQRSLN